MKLEAYIRDNTTVTEFARRIGKSRAQVHRYILGQNLSKAVIEEIRDATAGSVQPTDFFEPASKSEAAA